VGREFSWRPYAIEGKKSCSGLRVEETTSKRKGRGGVSNSRGKWPIKKTPDSLEMYTEMSIFPPEGGGVGVVLVGGGFGGGGVVAYAPEMDLRIKKEEARA